MIDILVCETRVKDFSREGAHVMDFSQWQQALRDLNNDMGRHDDRCQKCGDRCSHPRVEEVPDNEFTKNGIHVSGWSNNYNFCEKCSEKNWKVTPKIMCDETSQDGI